MKKYLLILLLLFGSNYIKAQQSETDSVAETPARAYFDAGKLNIATRDNKFKLWFDNRIFVDAAYYMPADNIESLSSKPNNDLATDDGQFRFSNGVSIRHARFGIKSTLYDRWFAELDIDFAYNQVEMKDIYLGYRINDHWSAKVGQFKEPMSIERMTSSRYLTALERPMPVEAFAGGRRIGGALTGWGNHWWIETGVFGRGADIIQKEKNRGNDGYGVSGRVALSPINNQTMAIHLGAYGSWRKPDMTGTADPSVEFNCFPEGRVDRRRFVRAEIKNVRHYSVLGTEFGIQYNKALLYGEYIYTRLSRYTHEGRTKINLKDADFNGWYVNASYMLLGRQRHYSAADAEFAPDAHPRKGGNLELCARVSTVNLNDFHDPSHAILGGKAYAYTASLNWFPNRNTMIGFNYSFIDNDKYADDKGHITLLGKPLSESMPQGLDFGICQMRFMVSF